MKLDAIDDETGEPTAVIPVALQDAPGYADYTAFALYDLISGRPIRLFRHEWRVMDDDIREAETLTDVYGEDDDEWSAAANAKLADYGFKLGMFCDRFGFTAGGGRYDMLHYDGFLLEEA